ncbi:hypothetical protein TruAng_010108 [Truncatella angustata]|nr:hypothetical protein TruAng_010108 [Truncatella angustata]
MPPMSTTTSCAWESNTWPDYPTVRYWHDLTYQPSKRPLYAFVRSGTVPAPRFTPSRHTDIPGRDPRVPSEWERQWRETQEYWWGLGAADPSDRGTRDEVPREEDGTERGAGDRNSERVGTADLWAKRVGRLNPSAAARPSPPCTGAARPQGDVVSILLGALGLVSLTGFCLSIAVTIGAALFVVLDSLVFRRYGKLGLVSTTGISPVWYENVSCFRSWTIALPVGATPGSSAGGTANRSVF